MDRKTKVRESLVAGALCVAAVLVCSAVAGLMVLAVQMAQFVSQYGTAASVAYTIGATSLFVFMFASLLYYLVSTVYD